MTHKIVTDPTVLTKPSEPIEDVEECKEIIAQLEKTLSGVKHGVGLSAVQIGIHKKVGVIKIENRGDIDNFYLINSKVIEEEDEFVFPNEGCLSINQKPARTKRFRHFVIENDMIVDDHFETREVSFYYDEDDRNSDGVAAIAVQHELDHFEGKLFLERSAYTMDEVAKAIEESAKPYRAIIKKRVGRNDPCPCGKTDANGKPLKFKKCCINRL